MKNHDKAKIIIEWQIKQNLQAGILKIDQKSYIYNLLEAKEISLYHPIVILIKVGSTLSLNQDENYVKSDLIVY